MDIGKLTDIAGLGLAVGATAFVYGQLVKGTRKASKKSKGVKWF